MQNGQLYTIADNNNVVAEGFFDVDNVQMNWNDGVHDEDLHLPQVRRVHRHIGMVAVSMKRFMDVTATGYEKLDEFEDEQFNNMIPSADCKAMVLDPVVDWISKVDNHVKANFSDEYGINITFFPRERGFDDRGEIGGGGNQSLRDILGEEAFRRVMDVVGVFSMMRQVARDINDIFDLNETRRGGVAFINSGTVLEGMDYHMRDMVEWPRMFSEEVAGVL